MVAAGWAVSYVDDDGVTAAAATGQDLVVISRTAGSSKVGTTFTASTVPVLTWTAGLYDELGLATTKGELLSQTSIDVTNPGHAIAAGRSGVTAVYSVAKKMAWGTPDASADVIATIDGDATKATVFVYEVGDNLTNATTAPARRVAVWPAFDTARYNTTDGWEIFDAAVSWAANLTTSSGTTYAYDQAGRRISATNANELVSYAYNARGQLAALDTTVAGATTTEARTYSPTGLLDSIAINSGGGDQIYDLVWDDQLGLPQLTRLDTPTNSYGFANGAGRAFAVDATGSVETFTLDALGNTISGPSELVRADWYWADGPANPNAPPNPVSFGHKSELTVGDTLYLRARNLDLSDAARFLTTDPLPGEVGTAVQTNPYHYANNNPIAFSDPSGMRPFGDTTLQWAHVSDSNGRSSSLIRPSYVNSPADMAEYLGSYAEQTGIIKTTDGYFAPLGDIWDAAVDIGPATYIEGALDLAGMVPAVGNFADGAAIAFYLAQDDFINAAISVFGLLPVIGQAVVLARGEIVAEAAIAFRYKPLTNIVDAKNWIKESFQKLFNKTPGTQAADLADASPRPPRAGDPRTVAVLETPSGGSYSGGSGFAGKPHASAQTALDSVPPGARSPFHGACAEIDCLSQAFEAGDDVAGGMISTARVRGPNSNAHGSVIDPCSSCQSVLDRLGVTFGG